MSSKCKESPYIPGKRSYTSTIEPIRYIYPVHNHMASSQEECLRKCFFREYARDICHSSACRPPIFTPCFLFRSSFFFSFVLPLFLWDPPSSVPKQPLPSPQYRMAKIREISKLVGSLDSVSRCKRRACYAAEEQT